MDALTRAFRNLDAEPKDDELSRAFRNLDAEPKDDELSRAFRNLDAEPKADQFAFADAEKDDPWYVDIGNALYAAGDATIGNVYRFGKDVIYTPVDFVRGADNTIFGQQRLLFNYLQGDNEEIDKIIAKGRERKPIEGNTTFGTWVRQAAESAPFLVENVLAGVGGGAVGSIAGPVGATAGGVAGAAATSYLQGWGEAFESLVNNDVDRDTAAKIATFAAAPYAGLDFFKMGPILKRIGADKLIAKLTVPRLLEMIKADKVLGSKVVKALGSGFIDTLQESAVEGLQGGTINAAEQYARGDWNTSEFIKSVKDDAVGSLGSMAVTIGGANAIGGIRRRIRSQRSGKEEVFLDEGSNEDLIKRDFDKEVGTPIGVTEQSPKNYQDRVIWATRFNREDMAEIEREAEKFAYKFVEEHPDAFKGREDEARVVATERRKLELMRNAHDYKLSLADLDKNIYAFDKVFGENGQPSRYAKDLQEYGEDALGEEIANEASADFGVGVDVSDEQANDALNYIAQNFDEIWDATQNAQEPVENTITNDLQKTPYAQNIEESNNEAEIDEAIWDDAEEVAGEVAQKFSKKTPTKKYSDLDDFLTNGIEKGKSTFFDFGELSPQAVERIKNDTGVDLKGYVHTLQGYGILHGENRHSSQNESLSGQVPITREDWKLADKIVNEFDKVVKSPKISKNQNEVLIFRKKIGDEIYYVAEARTGRKKLVSATMYKHKAKKEGPLQPEYPSQATRSRPKPSLDPSLNSEESQNFSENQEKKAKYSKNFEEEADAASGESGVGGLATYANEKKNIGGYAESFTFKPLLRPKLGLPKAFKEGKIVPLSTIRRWTAEALGIGVNLGVKADAKYDGVYNQDSDTINLKKSGINSLSLLFHEIGHALDERFFNSKISRLENTAVGKELYRFFSKSPKAEGYAKKEYISEGWAEFISDYVVNPKKAKKNFPNAYMFFEQKLKDEPELASILGKTREMVKRYQEANEKEKAAARVVKDENLEEFSKPFWEKVLSGYNWISERFADKYGALTDLQKIINKIEGEGTATFDDIRKNFVGGGHGQSMFSLMQEQIDFDGRVVGKSLKAILKPVNDRLDDFRLYLISRRCISLLRREGLLKGGKFESKANEFCLRASGLSLSQVSEAYFGADHKFKQAGMYLDKFNKNSLGLLIRGGFVSEYDAKEMAKDFGYVPFRRLMEFADAPALASQNSENNPIKHFTGSDREILDPLQVIAENAVIFRTLAAKNVVKLNLCKTVSRFKGHGKILEKDIARVQPVKVQKKAFARAVIDARMDYILLKSVGADILKYKEMEREDQIAFIADKISERNPYFKFFIWQTTVKSNPSEQIITTFENGKRTAWKVRDKSIYDALTHLDETTGRIANDFLNTLVGAIGKLNQLKKIGATANVPFAAMNFVRDQFTAGIYSSGNFIPFWTTFAKGILPAMLKSFSPHYREWVKAGGLNSNFVGGSKDLSIEAIAADGGAKRFKEYWKSNKLKATAEAAVYPLSWFSEFLETSTRVAEFRVCKEAYIESHGANKWKESPFARIQAANSSKQITVNFAESGTWGEVGNKLWIFFNARLQGLRKTIPQLMPIDIPIALRYLAGDKTFSAKHMYSEDGAAFLIRAVSQVAIWLVLKAAYGADDDEVPEWKRETFWNFKFGDKIVSIPKSQEVLPICEAMERILGADRKKPYWNFFLTTLFDFSLMPSAFEPFAEQKSNYSFFRGRPIISPYMQDLPKHLQRYPSTSQFMQMVSDFAHRNGVEVSPIVLEHYLTGYTAGLGKEALWWVDKVGSSLGAWQEGPKSLMKYSPTNPLSRFVGNHYGTSGAVEDFYEMRSEMRGVMSVARKIQKGELLPSDMNARERRVYSWYNARKWQINQIDKELTLYNNAIRRISVNEKLTASAKDANIKEFVKKRNSLAKLAKSLKFSEEAYEKWRADVLGD